MFFNYFFFSFPVWSKVYIRQFDSFFPDDGKQLKQKKSVMNMN